MLVPVGQDFFHFDCKFEFLIEKNYVIIVNSCYKIFFEHDLHLEWSHAGYVWWERVVYKPIDCETTRFLKYQFSYLQWLLSKGQGEQQVTPAH